MTAAAEEAFTRDAAALCEQHDGVEMVILVARARHEFDPADVPVVVEARVRLDADVYTKAWLYLVWDILDDIQRRHGPAMSAGEERSYTRPRT